MDEKINSNSKDYSGRLTIEQIFKLAMQEAQKGAPYVSPNPVVGCVITDSQGYLISTGYHQLYGEAHAEVNALKGLSRDQLTGARVYVTLEPCAHQGKTPSCAKALAQLPLSEVVYAIQDPNPLVAGQGAKIIQNAGIQISEYQGPLKSDLEDLAEVFLKNFREKKIFVAAKIATSLDGQIALKSGESQWITGSESRTYVHELRSYYDALLVGHKTIEIDNPSLNIRHPTITKKNKLIILDSHLNILKKINSGFKFKFLECHDPSDIYFVRNTNRLNSQSYDKAGFDSNNDSDVGFDASNAQNEGFQIIDYLDLPNLNEKLWNLNLRSLFIEGGGATYSSFLQADLIDRLYVFMAPSLIGAKNGLSWTENLSIPQLSEKLKFENMKFKIFGEDLFITAKKVKI